jgi:hypothetical protein
LDANPANNSMAFPINSAISSDLQRDLNEFSNSFPLEILLQKKAAFLQPGFDYQTEQRVGKLFLFYFYL